MDTAQQYSAVAFQLKPSDAQAAVATRELAARQPPIGRFWGGLSRNTGKSDGAAPNEGYKGNVELEARGSAQAGLLATTTTRLLWHFGFSQFLHTALEEAMNLGHACMHSTASTS
ncbi:hypothetical protein PG990_000760 [Apiospora arundinis]